MGDLIPSISYDQHDIIRWILKLHVDNEQFDVDPTWGRGVFYKPQDILVPKFVSDIRNDLFIGEEMDGIVVHRGVEATNLPIPDRSVGSIMFDPPFLSKTGEGSIIKDRFGYYPTMLELWDFYTEAIWEFNRILWINGIFVIKCQNTVMSGKQWWSINFVEETAFSFGFEKIDEFILLAKHRMSQHNIIKQRHARKYHSFFLVFKKLTDIENIKGA